MNAEEEVTKEKCSERDEQWIQTLSPDQYVGEKAESDLAEQVASEFLENDVNKYC